MIPYWPIYVGNPILKSYSYADMGGNIATTPDGFGFTDQKEISQKSTRSINISLTLDQDQFNAFEYFCKNTLKNCEKKFYINLVDGSGDVLKVVRMSKEKYKASTIATDKWRVNFALQEVF